MARRYVNRRTRGDTHVSKWKAMKWGMFSLAVALAIALSGVAGFAIGDGGSDSGRTSVSVSDAKGFNILNEIYAILQEDFVNPDAVDPDVLRMGAINGLLQARGEQGTQVALGIEHSDGATEEVSITRGTIVVPTVFTRDIEDAAGEPVDEFAYIELQQFTDQAVRDLREELEKDIDAGYEGIILDLRRNPGGGLEATVQTADMFLDDGVILTEVSRDGDRSVTRAEPGGPATEIPVVLLVGPGSASGSEVLACALRDNGRATLVGEQTFGKGSVNHLRELSDSGALYVSIARWECPGGEQIEGVGVEPDVKVAFTEEDIQADRDVQLFAAIDFLRENLTSAAP